MSNRRHSNAPIKHTTTGQGFALKAEAKSLRAQFDAWRARFESENAKLRAQRDALLEASEAVLEHIDESQGIQAGSEETGSDFFDGANGTDARLALEAAVAKAKAQ